MFRRKAIRVEVGENAKYLHYQPAECRIYHLTFESIAGVDPKPLRADLVADEIARVRARAEESTLREVILREVDQVVEGFAKLRSP